ncbi:methylated-DNA--[protein]-cysteine S-methyltransferase [Streptomyces sp. NPDC088090]|uniref:methylated-DNA--[protein]-cysteine S-methyltransferase n=1 Tax=Streptomyces sp. NPDC088090 TaxID=3365822 RepID=UPI00384F579C
MDDITVYAYADGPLGEMLLTGRLSTGGRAVLRSLSLPGQKGAVAVGEGWVRDQGAFDGAVRQLAEYFDGRRERFDVELDAGAGTEFQRRVWAALEEIPYGTTVSYGEIGRRVGAGGVGVRAVGTAIGRNPLLVVRPCHRVIGADGSLRGYAAGPERKRSLLGLEGALA